MDDRKPAFKRQDLYIGEPADGGVCEYETVWTDDETGSAVVGYGPESDPLSVAVPTLVAQCESVDPCELPPMYDAVDPDALDRLVSGDGSAESTVEITFGYAGYTVAVGDGELAVTPETT